MMDGATPVEFLNVEVIEDTGLLLRCRVAGRVVGIPPLRVLSGTEVRRLGDRGRLVLPWQVAESLGLLADG